MSEVRTNIVFDAETYARALALARTNYPTPKRGGNINGLIRMLINQAYLFPEKFGMVPPSNEPGPGEQPR